MAKYSTKPCSCGGLVHVVHRQRNGKTYEVKEKCNACKSIKDALES